MSSQKVASEAQKDVASAPLPPPGGAEVEEPGGGAEKAAAPMPTPGGSTGAVGVGWGEMRKTAGGEVYYAIEDPNPIPRFEGKVGEKGVPLVGDDGKPLWEDPEVGLGARWDETEEEELARARAEGAGDDRLMQGFLAEAARLVTGSLCVEWVHEQTAIYIGSQEGGGEGGGYGLVVYGSSDRMGRVYYLGEMKEGKRDGYGVISMRDGSRYKGQWVRNRKHGWGMDQGADYVFLGQFEKGLRHGPGVLADVNFHRTLGVWKEGHKHGDCIEVSPEEEEEMFTYEKGEAQGGGRPPPPPEEGEEGRVRKLSDDAFAWGEAASGIAGDLAATLHCFRVVIDSWPGLPHTMKQLQAAVDYRCRFLGATFRPPTPPIPEYEPEGGGDVPPPSRPVSAEGPGGVGAVRSGSLVVSHSSEVEFGARVAALGARAEELTQEKVRTGEQDEELRRVVADLEELDAAFQEQHHIPDSAVDEAQEALGRRTRRPTAGHAAKQDSVIKMYDNGVEQSPLQPGLRSSGGGLNRGSTASGEGGEREEELEAALAAQAKLIEDLKRENGEREEREKRNKEKDEEISQLRAKLEARERREQAEQEAAARERARMHTPEELSHVTQTLVDDAEAKRKRLEDIHTKEKERQERLLQDKLKLKRASSMRKKSSETGK